MSSLSDKWKNKPSRLYADVKVGSLEEFKEMIMAITASVTGSPPEDLLSDEQWKAHYSTYLKNAQKAQNDR